MFAVEKEIRRKEREKKRRKEGETNPLPS